MRLRRTPRQRVEIAWTYIGIAASIGVPWLIFGYAKPTGWLRIAGFVLTGLIGIKTYSYIWSLNWNSVDIRFKKRSGTIDSEPESRQASPTEPTVLIWPAFLGQWALRRKR